jgi:hypothetical protein
MHESPRRNCLPDTPRCRRSPSLPVNCDRKGVEHVADWIGGGQFPAVIAGADLLPKPDVAIGFSACISISLGL